MPSLFRTIAEYTYDWETWVDAAGVTRWINSAVERITGYTVEACLASRAYPLDLAFEEDRPLLARVLDDAARGGSGNDVEFRILHRDGRPRWVAISWQAVREGEQHLGYRTSIRDIDERKRIEEELHVMRRRAEAAAVARSELLANVSHELRSPIHCIAGFSELLLDTTLDETQRRYLELIARECVGMQRHVEDLLQLAALEAGGARLERRPFDLEELVTRVRDAEGPVARARGLTLATELSLAQRWVEGDPTRVGQVLRNLVDNALKFTDAGAVHVEATSTANDQHADVTLVVRDTGCGMEASMIGRLLQPFQQAASASTRRHGGVGLGLSIVKRLVAAMDGNLRIESTPGRGTIVSVRLRLPCAPPAPRDEAPRIRRRHRGEHALIVDDSATARELLRALLERSGCRVVEADSGKMALARAAAQPFDLVLLDYQMPDADGPETAIALRRAFAAHRGRERTPIYLLTANAFAREQLDSSRSAIDGILEKPLTREALAALLDGLSATRTHAPAGRAAAARAALDARVIEDLCALSSRDGESMFARVLDRTRVDQKETLERLAQVAGLADTLAIASEAHRVAGQAAVIGARAVAARARFLERRARRGPLTCESALRAARGLAYAWGEAERALAACDPRRAGS